MTADGPLRSYRRWLRTGFLLGAAVGVAISLCVYWYFEVGPGLASPDGAEAHGLWIAVLGAPVSWLLEFLPSVLLDSMGYLWVVLSFACSWGVLGTIVSGIAAMLVRSFRSAT